MDYVFRDQLGRMVNEYHTPLDGAGYWAESRTYDAMGRVSSDGAPWHVASGYEYTPAYETSYAYDLLGRVTAITRPENQSVYTPQTTTFAYAGRTQTVIDPQSKVTTKILDVNGWMRRSQDHDGYYQSFGYDAAGSLKQVSDSLSNTLFTANYSYGVQAFQDYSWDMDLGARNNYYDSLGEITSWSDAKSQSFSQIFDPLSRVTSRTEAEGTTSWTWGNSATSHNIGQLASVSMTGYSETLSYDSIGRLSTQSITTDQGYAIDYAYNSLGLLDSLTYPISTSSTRVKVKYGYAYGILNSVTDWTTGSAGTVYWTANTMNPRGQTTQDTLGNGVVTSRAIDAVTGWTSSIQSGLGGGAGVQNQSYLYDLVGNVTQRQENNLGLTENFYYDDLYRLSHSTLNSTTNLSLSYDAMGNITSRSDIGGGSSWTYDATKKHAVTSAGGQSYSYDANGNMTNRNGATISWTSYNYPTNLNTASESASFSYGPDRQYYQQVYSSSAGTETTHYVHGLLEKVELPTGATDWRHYVMADGKAVAIVSRLSSGTNSVTYPLDDHQGSSSVLTSSSGTSAVKESFNSFGLPRDGSSWSGPVPSGDQITIGSISREGFTGHDMLGSMGLIHMNGRVQDADTGRFLSADPYMNEPDFTQSFNRYSYVLNNPLKYIDPSGFCTDRFGQEHDDYYDDGKGRCDPMLQEIVVQQFNCDGVWVSSPQMCDALRQYLNGTGPASLTPTGQQGSLQTPQGVPNLGIAQKAATSGEFASDVAKRLGDSRNSDLLRIGGKIGSHFSRAAGNAFSAAELAQCLNDGDAECTSIASLSLALSRAENLIPEYGAAVSAFADVTDINKGIATEAVIAAEKSQSGFVSIVCQATGGYAFSSCPTPPWRWTPF